MISAAHRAGAAVFLLLAALYVPARALAQTAKGPVLVITASGRDYLFGAGGTLAQLIDQGRDVYVLQFGNDEKDSAGLGPADTRIANNREAEQAARKLGVKEWLNLGHKSGELGQLSSSELRNQVMTMVRFYKPESMFFPDWYIHYQDDNDVYRVGRMAEEAPYGGGSYFVQEMTYIGYGGFAAREYYFYSPYRPYRPREGGEDRATIKGVDIGNTFDRKMAAIAELKTGNLRYAVQTKQRLVAAGRSADLLREINERSTLGLVRAFVEELGAAVGAKHGFQFAEEFNHLGTGGGIPQHIREQARPGN
jgi:LmbE family N-acetylglucosaminyl deacetylase